MGLKVVAALGQAIVCEAALPGRRKYGVPPRGPFDVVSATLANALVGNAWDVRVLELAGAAIEFECDRHIWASAVGFGHQVSIDGHALSDHSRFEVNRGQRLSIHPTRVGMRLYLGFPGGVDLDSCSDKNPQLVMGHEIRARAPGQFRSPARLERFPLAMASTIMVTSDCEFDEFAAHVTPHMNRVGVRFDASLDRVFSATGTSSPSIFGALQGTPEGQLIVHGPDGPTIGGYEIVGVVPQYCLPRLAQLRPGETVQFVWQGVDDARLESRRVAERISNLVDSILLRLS